ncbi:hypothetical protein SAMN04487898_104360 [Pedobacter sp. ok626]|uniref:hypothetical protein n=1 Tax=Pedobacter sp. ok626 TaxID=1761882 RepID=UPI0008906C5D|nr:hypothetical protein [Pedobacter sp. ok626]SDJ82293.1 hypothetical protein SAMN04487898_104360 [Pedobacter sp. ok626]
MKKLSITMICICFLSALHAQILKPVKNTNNSQQASTSGTTINDADYFLAVAKVTLKTGKDNKENGSSLILRVYPAAGSDNWRKGYNQENYKSELKVWGTNDFTLPRSAAFDQNFNSLAHYRQTGIMVDVNYNTVGNGPFFALDAWKIEEVSVTLEFKDKNGNLHPTMGSKTIYFTDSNMYLDFKKWQLYCKTDQYFNALTPFITNRPMN